MTKIQLNSDQLEDWKEIVSKIGMASDAVRGLQECDPPHLKASAVRETFLEVTSDEKLSTALARQLLSLASYRRQLNLEPETAVSDLIGSVGADIISNEGDKFSALLLSAVNLESIILSAKALFLSFRTDAIYRDGSVITDIRPVFNSEDPDKIFGAVIMQTLNIKYLSQNKRESISLSMDLEDIQALIGELERARTKGEISLKMLNENGYQGFITGDETYGF